MYVLLSHTQEANVGQMIQERQHKIERLKYSVQLLKVCSPHPSILDML